MKKRKLKGFVLPTIYIMVIGVIFVSIFYLDRSLNKLPNDELDYSVSTIKDDVVPVIQEVSKKPMKPFVGEKVVVIKDFYSKDDDENIQKNSLIYYQNTYLQNTGILYGNNEPFDAVAVLDGKVKNISTNDILGNVIEISHNNNLTSFYYSVDEIKVKINDPVKIGDVIAKSGDNKIENKEGKTILFEVYYQGKALDPNSFYEMELKDLE